LLSACADTQYYWQSVTGHLELMQAARPIDKWLADASTPEALKLRLSLAQQLRQFAVTKLHLPDNPSYQRYADLHRRFVVWNVVAAPEYSLTLKTWCFPVAGCVGYRGYFSETEAQTHAQALRDQGLEASVYGVPAYSTLGWSNWFGGDPLLNTFISYPEGELARMLFHELSHQVLYVPDDTMFNESFATAVERLGGEQWLMQASISARQEYAEFNVRRHQFRALTRSTRDKLHQIYTQINPVVPVSQAQEAIKKEAIEAFQSEYAALKQSWGGYSGYDTWVAQANNAAFGAQAAYDELVPGFEALFARHGGDWLRFYDAVRQLSKYPTAERVQLLKQLTMEQHRG
jgi:predicted aminopeptidase